MFLIVGLCYCLDRLVLPQPLRSASDSIRVLGWAPRISSLGPRPDAQRRRCHRYRVHRPARILRAWTGSLTNSTPSSCMRLYSAWISPTSIEKEYPKSVRPRLPIYSSVRWNPVFPQLDSLRTLIHPEPGSHQRHRRFIGDLHHARMIDIVTLSIGGKCHYFFVETRQPFDVVGNECHLGHPGVIAFLSFQAES